MPRFYLTTGIDYVNSRPHLGTAYEKITADVVARYKRLAGFDVHFVMGNDEHSQNVFKRAREQGLPPLEYCDRMETTFRDVWRRLDVSFDDFIRTTEPRHKRAVEAFVQRSHEAGDVYAGVYEGYYCVSCEEFKRERDLVDGLCPVHQTKPEWIKERNYFFRLSAFQDRLLAHYAEHPSFVAPESRRNEMLRLIEGGLEDISVSRAGQAWGIPVPFDPTGIVYVWYDALINYIAAVGYGAESPVLDQWWPADVHFVGKDITRFHAIVWPAMLMSVGLPLPKQIFGHGWVLTKGQKMSKSLGTVIDPLETTDRLGPDPLRLYLTKEIVFGSDGDFTLDRFEEKYNVDLANNLGNLVSRLTAMADRYRRGRLTAAPVADRLAESVTTAAAGYHAAMDRFALETGCQEAFRLVDAVNEYIAASEPWALAKAGRDEALDTVLWSAAEGLRVAAVLLSPVMPHSCEKILARLDAPVRQTAELRFDRDAAVTASGVRQLTHAEALWPRLEAERVPADVTMKERPVTDVPKDVPAPAPAAAPPAAAAASAVDARLSIEEFMKVDLRVARVLAAERIPNSKKLMKLQIDLGSEQRQIVAGIAEAYPAESLVGRSIAVVANLKPAKLMGVESNGMVLCASPDGAAPILLAFDQPAAPGTRIR